MQDLKIDSHKLSYHIERLGNWLKGDLIYPIYLEIALSGACNHRCVYCALDFLGYKPHFIDTKLIKTRLPEMAKLGVKSVMFAGEGEPLLHRDAADIIHCAQKSGLDTALTTNGVFLTKELVEKITPRMSWIKVSVNAAAKKTYAGIHRTSPLDLSRVMDQMTYAAKLKKKKGYACRLGLQLLLLPENAGEVVLLARKARDMGMDYFVVKPYSHHPRSLGTRYRNITYGSYYKLAAKLQALNTGSFRVIFRLNAMRKWDKVERGYKRCYALPFWAYIDAAGQVWGCSAWIRDEKFRCGDIYKNTFSRIWGGRRRRDLLRLAENRLEARRCRIGCRMDEINRYLWELKHPPEHVNFI